MRDDSSLHMGSDNGARVKGTRQQTLCRGEVASCGEVSDMVLEGENDFAK